MKYLITGGCGFLGSNLASEVISRGEELIVLDNLYRFGSEQNLAWLRQKGNFKYIHGDVRNQNDVFKIIKDFRPDYIFHVAGQVAMTTSLENPRLDFEINVLGSFNILEACRQFSPETILCYSSTNKVYGDLEELKYRETETRHTLVDFPIGIPETMRLDFRTPYGCSKGSADQYMLDYYRRFGIRTVVFRHSSIYGGRQFSTADQGWIGWFAKQALDIKKGKIKSFTISGDGKQVRDVLFSSDLIDCYFSSVSHINKTAGEVFNIGGGQANSLSLLELFAHFEKSLNVKMNHQKLPARASDQKVFIADITKAAKLFNWKPQIPYSNGLEKMISWVSEI